MPMRRVGQRHERPEQQVGDLFGRLELPPSWRQRVVELVECGGDVVDGVGERKRLQGRIARARQGLIDGVLDAATAKAAIKQAEAALAGLRETPHVAIEAGHTLTRHRGAVATHDGGREAQPREAGLIEAVVHLRSGDVTGLLPKTSFAPLFHVLAEEEGGLIRFCGWRPRGESGSPGAKSPYYALRIA